MSDDLCMCAGWQPLAIGVIVVCSAAVLARIIWVWYYAVTGDGQ